MNTLTVNDSSFDSSAIYWIDSNNQSVIVSTIFIWWNSIEGSLLYFKNSNYSVFNSSFSSNINHYNSTNTDPAFIAYGNSAGIINSSTF